jgi:nitroreductase
VSKSKSRPWPAAAPEFGDPLDGAPHCQETLDLLARRRSSPATILGEPGPTREEVNALLKLAARVPDHGRLTPWRFVVFEGDARKAAGDILESRRRQVEPGLPVERYLEERGRFARAPVVVAVISRTRDNHPKVPEWEQVLSAGAVCQNLLIAANAMGFGAQWITEWCAYDAGVRTEFGLGSGERIAGFVYVGTPTDEPRERKRPEMSELVTRWTP